MPANSSDLDILYCLDPHDFAGTFSTPATFYSPTAEAIMRIEHQTNQLAQDPSPLGPPRPGLIQTRRQTRHWVEDPETGELGFGCTLTDFDLESGGVENVQGFSVRTVREVPMLSTQLLREHIVGDTPSSALSSSEVAVALPTGTITIIESPLRHVTGYSKYFVRQFSAMHGC